MNKEDKIWCNVTSSRKNIDTFAEWEINLIENVIYQYMNEFSRKPITAKGNEDFFKFMEFQVKEREKAKDYYAANIKSIICNIDFTIRIDK